MLCLVLVSTAVVLNDAIAAPLLEAPTAAAPGDGALSSRELEQVLGVSTSPLAANTHAQPGVEALDARTLLDGTIAPDSVELEQQFSIWQPDELQAPTDTGPNLRSTLSRYVNSGGYVGSSGAADIRHDDPVFYQDPSMLEVEAKKKAAGLIQMVFRPTVESQTGEVRFSVFGFGSFKLEREKSDGHIKLLNAEPVEGANEPLQDLSLSATHGDTVTYSGGEFATGQPQSDLLWLLESARKNPWHSLGALLTLMLLIGGVTRWVEGRGAARIAQSPPVPPPSPPRSAEKHTRSAERGTRQGRRRHGTKRSQRA